MSYGKILLDIANEFWNKINFPKSISLIDISNHNNLDCW